MKKITDPEPLSKSGIIGVSWAGSGGESSALLKDQYLAADGIESVVKILEEIEDEKLNDLDFIELNSCPVGCVGGVLNIENPYIARARIQILRKWLPVSKNHLKDSPDSMLWDKKIEATDKNKLSEDLSKAMDMMARIDELNARLPALDCGSCGAPTCRALAEDVVKGIASEIDCVYVLRDQVELLAGKISTL